MKKLLFLSWLMMLLATDLVAADSTRIFLVNKPMLRVGDTALNIQIMAKNSYKLDVAGLQGRVKVAQSALELVELKALKPDGTIKDALAFMGESSIKFGERITPIVMASTAIVPKVSGDSVALILLKFRILKSLTKGESLKVSVDKIEATTFGAKDIRLLNQDSTTSIELLVADSVGGEDTTETDDRLRLRMFLRASNVDEGYLYQQEPKKSELDLVLRSRVLVSSLQLTVQAPNSSWILSQPNLVDGVGTCIMNNLGGGKYKILYTRPSDQPLIPGIDGASKNIMKLSFALSDGKMPFGSQRIVISGIAVASLFESGLKVNADTSVTVNINKLFGKVFGRKGDVNYEAEWQCGDGRIDKADPDLVSSFIIGQIEFNDYQRWSSDVTSDGKTEVDDLIELQKWVLLSSVKDQIEAGKSFTLPAGSRLIVSNLLGQLVMSKVADYEDQEIDLNDLQSGQYVWIISSASSATFNTMGKMLIL